ncbi:MAG: DUF6514 family protein [Oscillospiraceae bacterium]|jgi:hypothetical protein|nr:DUF6514 family protein [Oscillospiraceae bacterium]
MAVRYCVFSEKISLQGLGEHTGWGIEVRPDDGSPVGRIRDISENRPYVELLAEMLNSEGAEAVHLRDIVEDILGR